MVPRQYGVYLVQWSLWIRESFFIWYKTTKMAMNNLDQNFEKISKNTDVSLNKCDLTVLNKAGITFQEHFSYVTNFIVIDLKIPLVSKTSLFEVTSILLVF